ncbi:RNA-directed DNA polymerase, eukaryota, reverse transcriptase zinc-binding domain protein [Tanacetum coccineum]
MIFKVDFEKAYDSVHWDYLDDVLKRFGFGEKWCGWIQNCLLSSKGSVIVNGSPTKEFQFHRGLKQGDPLSPFLFLLIMESLHISMQRVVDAGLFKGIQVGSSLQVSHLFYADDARQGGSDSKENWMCNSSIPKLAALCLGFNRSLPTYHMSLFKVPAKVLLNMESIRCHFFNGIEHKGKKPIWVKWNKVLASKEKGGIHGEDEKIGKHVRSHHPSLWLDIVKEVHHIQRQGTDLMGFIHRKIGNGVNIRFWEDKWRGDNTFQSDFPRISKTGAECASIIFAREIYGGINSFRIEGYMDGWSLEVLWQVLIALRLGNSLTQTSLPNVSLPKTRWIKAAYKSQNSRLESF